ncbi:MAG: MarC family protein [Bacteroidales bacterium]|nr:MarC family protein [Bacteroidales bacterium]
MNLTFVDIFTVFMVLFAVIDITGSIPIIIDIKRKCGTIDSLKSTIIAYLILLLFLLFGEPFLKLFGVDIHSFSIAGSIVLFFLGLEMIMGIEFFKMENIKGSSVVPISFPLIAGAGTMTALISLKAEYSLLVIFIALTINMIIVYFVLRATRFFERILGISGIQILKKVFGIILLAIAIRLFLAGTGIQIGGNGA